MVYTILVVVQVVIAFSLIGLILMQHGKGADAGAAFGSGASGTVFGAQGSANFLTRATAGLATLFMAISLVLAYLINGASMPSGSVTEGISQPGANAELLSDQNNNGVPGDAALAEEAQGGAQSDAGAASEEADTSAQVPE